jgi:4-amino-4-deoxy-L-arabinose transferase-like glycosyltransferase
MAWLSLVTLTLFVVRVTGPSNLLDNDQERPAAYVLDVVLNGHWWCQTDWTGDIMSKPPLFTWIGAGATVVAGRANLVSLYVPCLAAMFLAVGLIAYFGRAGFGWPAGFLGGLMYLAAPSGVKHIALARTDGLFAATIALTAFTGYRAWKTGRGWIWFWLGAALATLTKGPLGLVLGLMGLLAVLWERFDQHRRRDGRDGSSVEAREPRRHNVLLQQTLGILLFLVMLLGWFGLAYQQGGQAFIDKVIGKELVGHVVGEDHGTLGVGFVKAPLYWLSRFLPWSLLACVGLWRVVAHPAADAEQRRFERFLFCWIVGGLFLFSLATHQRGDLPLPLYPPAAVLAGREMARWFPRIDPRRLLQRSLSTVAVALALYTTYLHTVFANTWEVRHSEAVEALARELARNPSLPRLLHVDSPYALQFHLNTMHPTVSLETAAKALALHEPVAVAVCSLAQLREQLGEEDGLLELGQAPASQRDSVVYVVTHPEPSPR